VAVQLLYTSMQHEMLVATLNAPEQHLHVGLDVMILKQYRLVPNDALHIVRTKFQDQMQHSVTYEYINHLKVQIDVKCNSTLLVDDTCLHL
jgi:hypothetical protein